MQSQIDALPEELWILISQQLPLCVLPKFAIICRSFAKLIRSLDWSAYYYGQISPNLFQLYEKIPIDLSFMQHQGHLIINASESIHRQWLKLYAHIIHIDTLVKNCEKDIRLDMEEAEQNGEVLDNEELREISIDMKEENNNGDIIHCKKIIIQPLHDTVVMNHWVGDTHISCGYVHSDVLTLMQEVLLTCCVNRVCVVTGDFDFLYEIQI